MNVCFYEYTWVELLALQRRTREGNMNIIRNGDPQLPGSETGYKRRGHAGIRSFPTKWMELGVCGLNIFWNGGLFPPVYFS